MRDPYFIVALPRSRTAWLSILLSHGTSQCFHEAINQCDPQSILHDLAAILNSPHPQYRHIGDSDSGLPLLWPQLNEVFPNARYVFVERPFMAAFNSHRRAFPCLKEKLVRQAFDKIQDHLTQMKRQADMSIGIKYDQLDDPMILNYIWEFCVPGEKFDMERSERLQTLRVNQIFDAVVERAHSGWAAPVKLLKGE